MLTLLVNVSRVSVCLQTHLLHESCKYCVALGVMLGSRHVRNWENNDTSSDLDIMI